MSVLDTSLGSMPAGSISGDTLASAVAQGVLTAEQVDALRQLERARTAPPPAEPKDDENFRFINGFSDIFVTIGLALFLGALSYSFNGAPGSLAVAVASWLLAEYFTRRRRMALPSIVLLLVFAVSVFVAVAEILDATPIRTLFYFSTRAGRLSSLA